MKNYERKYKEIMCELEKIKSLTKEKGRFVKKFS